MTVMDGSTERQGEEISLSRTASGEEFPTAWQRARSVLRDRDPVVGWVATLTVTAFALVMRLWHLGTPREFEFDETYYAKDAWSLLHFGYARTYSAQANEQILAGHTTGSFQDGPEMVVHPEVGKWLIALGEKAFGMDPFGWRIASAVVGALMILVMVRLVRRMTGSTLIGVAAGLLLSFDGLQFVLSRLALLDIFVAFFTLCAVSCAVADRDWFRERLAGRVQGSRHARPQAASRLEQRSLEQRSLEQRSLEQRSLEERSLDRRWWGPRMLWRPWLLASGLCWGLAIGTKWTALYPLAAFGVLVVVWSAGARRSFGVRLPLVKSALVDGVPAFVHLVVVAALVYTVSWTGWLMHAHAYEQTLSSTQYTQYTGQGHCDKQTYVSDDPDPDKRWPTATEPDAHGLGEVGQSLRSLWYYHEDVWTFHTHFLNCATHVYASSPAGWLILNRPVGVSATTGIKPGDDGCTAPTGSDCIRQVLLLGTPLLWWGGVVALLYAVAMWLGARDWRFGVAVVGAASTWLPWFLYDDRPIFSYYAIVSLPFLVLALALTMGKLIGHEAAPSRRRTVGVVVSGAYLVLVIANFAWFWPIYTDGLLTHASWLDRIWFQRWI